MARRELLDRIDRKFDPTDSNAASDVVEAALKLMEVSARALRDYHNGLRIGRDNSVEMGVAISETARKMKLLPYNYTAKDAEELFNELCK